MICKIADDRARVRILGLMTRCIQNRIVDKDDDLEMYQDFIIYAVQLLNDEKANQMKRNAASRFLADLLAICKD